LRCLICEKLSISHICKNCRIQYLSPNIFKRELSSGLKVISFYQYDEITDLIKTKNSYLGFYIFKILAESSIKLFLQELNLKTLTYLIPIDDKVSKSGYSHTAILTNKSRVKKTVPLYRSLISQSKVKYIGQSLNFRLENRRDFKIGKNIPKNSPLILIDDVITTGSTLNEANEILQKYGVKDIFALTLASTQK